MLHIFSRLCGPWRDHAPNQGIPCPHPPRSAPAGILWVPSQLGSHGPMRAHVRTHGTTIPGIPCPLRIPWVPPGSPRDPRGGIPRGRTLFAFPIAPLFFGGPLGGPWGSHEGPMGPHGRLMAASLLNDGAAKKIPCCPRGPKSDF